MDRHQIRYTDSFVGSQAPDLGVMSDAVAMPWVSPCACLYQMTERCGPPAKLLTG